MGSWGGPLTADRSGLCPLCSWRCKATGTAACQKQPCQPAPAQHRAGGMGGGEERRGTREWGEAMAGGMEGAGGSRGRAGVPLPGLDEIR